MQVSDKEALSFFLDLKYWLLAYLPDLEDVDILTYSINLIGDGFDSFDMIDELTKEDLLFMSPQHMQTLAKQLPERTDNEAAEKEEHFDITRDSFSDRPSLAAAPMHHMSPSLAERSGKSVREKDQNVEVSSEEASFDITRDALKPRPSPAAAVDQHRTQRLAESEGVRRDSSDLKLEAPKSSGMAPRAELYQYYINEGLTTEQASELKDYYTVWTNGALPHEKKFSCIFTCPISGEHFPAGDWGENSELSSDGHQIYWYRESLISFNYIHHVKLHFNLMIQISYLDVPFRNEKGSLKCSGCQSIR
jgi:hypothetical protein